MNTFLLQQKETDEQMVFDNAFPLHDELYDLILKKSGETFSVIIQNTNGCLHFHEQEIAEQLGVSAPTLLHFQEFIGKLYSSGVNLKRTRDYQVKLLVEACPEIFHF